MYTCVYIQACVVTLRVTLVFWDKDSRETQSASGYRAHVSDVGGAPPCLCYRDVSMSGVNFSLQLLGHVLRSRAHLQYGNRELRRDCLKVDPRQDDLVGQEPQAQSREASCERTNSCPSQGSMVQRLSHENHGQCALVSCLCASPGLTFCP